MNLVGGHLKMNLLLLMMSFALLMDGWPGWIRIDVNVYKSRKDVRTYGHTGSTVNRKFRPGAGHPFFHPPLENAS